MAATAVNDRPLDLVWGAEAIGEEIGRNARQTFYLLSSGAIKSAKKINAHWCADRVALRAEFRARLDARAGAEAAE
jgi:hypothetical protein